MGSIHLTCVNKAPLRGSAGNKQGVGHVQGGGPHRREVGTSGAELRYPYQKRKMSGGC